MIGGLLVASKIIDAFTDLGIGYLIDRTHTRFGKARPYEFFIVLQWLFTILMFSVPNVNTAIQYVYVFIMYVIVNVSLASLTSLIAPVALIFFPMLAKKFGTSKILQCCALLGIIGMAIRTVGGPNMATILIGGAFQGLGLMPISLMINTYIIDCMDYGEWKTGVRVEGMIASVINFSNKAGGAVASGVVGLVMGLAGYDGNLAVQSEGAMNAIVGLYNWFPLLLFIGCCRRQMRR